LHRQSSTTSVYSYKSPAKEQRADTAGASPAASARNSPGQLYFMRVSCQADNPGEKHRVWRTVWTVSWIAVCTLFDRSNRRNSRYNQVVGRTVGQQQYNMTCTIHHSPSFTFEHLSMVTISKIVPRRLTNVHEYRKGRFELCI
jgi:hypothetical protein